MDRHRTLLTGCALAGLLVATAHAQGPGSSQWEGRGGMRGPGGGQQGQDGGQMMGGRSTTPLEAGLSRETMVAHFISTPEVAEKLGLSAEQSSQIRDQLQSIRKEHIRLRAEQEIAAMEQVRLLAADTVDEDAVMKAVEKTGQISIEMAKLQVTPILAIKKILSPEQLKQARDMIRTRAREFRGSQEGPQRSFRRPPSGDQGDGGPESDMMPPPMEE
jgi:Spy/CpxP family protein refolding chaperone